MLRRQAWSDAFSHLSTADREDGLDPDDLVELAQAAQLIGKESESAELLARAQQGFLRRGDTQRAVRCAFWLGFVALINGEVAQAGGCFLVLSACWQGSPTVWKGVICSCRPDIARFTGAIRLSRMRLSYKLRR